VEIQLFTQGEIPATAGATLEFQAVADPVIGIDPCFPARDRYQVQLSQNLFPEGVPRCRIEPPGFLRVAPGTAVAFRVACSDPGDTLTLSTDGLPSGASMTPPLPATGGEQVESSFSWTPSAPGRVVVLFTARDSAAHEARASMLVEVVDGPANRPPIADAGPDRVVPSTGEFTPVSLDASRSSDADGDPLSFEWVDPDGHIVAVGDSRDPVVEDALRPGRHTLTLIVADAAAETACDTVVVEVAETGSTTSTTLAPIASTSTTSSPASATTSTTTTTLPPLPGTISVEPLGTPSTGARIVCTLADPSARKGAFCELEGFDAGESVTLTRAEGAPGVTKKMRRRFDRRGRAVLKLRLNAAGKELLRRRGELRVLLRVTMADGRGRRGTIERLVTILRRQSGRARIASSDRHAPGACSRSSRASRDSFDTVALAQAHQQR
jgi:hypothetical protein